MFTGLALKVYLNEKPFEPRERDYALVGSFFAFCIWIGFGVYALFDLLRKITSQKLSAPIAVIVSLLCVPTLMAYQNWDDHDRSGKYSAQAIAHSYLDSIQEDVGAMIFTIGDNDTFLLWYAQEIEGYRTDVRTINTSLLATDWYIDQMKRKAYESDPIPSQLKHSQYAYGVRDVVHFLERTKSRWNIKDLMNWIASDDPNTTRTLEDGSILHYYPTNKIRVPVSEPIRLRDTQATRIPTHQRRDSGRRPGHRPAAFPEATPCRQFPMDNGRKEARVRVGVGDEPGERR